jgi:hypothetical protein
MSRAGGIFFAVALVASLAPPVFAQTVPADQLERLVTQVYETPPDLIETVKKLVPNLQ